MLKINVRALPCEAPHEHRAKKATAVIDVLRATTVMATALDSGASCIYTTAEIEAAHRIRENIGSETLLCGERNGSRIDGFDLGNSPYEFNRQMVEDKVLVMCTTNGTKAVEAGRGSELLIALSFVNLSAAAGVLLQSGLPVELLCSGTNGRFSMDDALCAGMTIAWLSRHAPVQTDDLGTLLLNFARQQGSISQKLQNCSHRLFLEASGYQRDIAFCFDLDRFNTVPILSPEGCFVAFKA